MPETRQALERLSRYDEGDLAHLVQDMADAARALVPACVGLSLSLRESGITLTLVASDEEAAALDAVQYVDGGPCVEVGKRGVPIEVAPQELLDEGTWQMYARATAAAGIRSSLSLPVKRGTEVIGAVNMYAATPDAFDGHVRELAGALGASAEDAIRNADLSFSTRLHALEGPAAVADAEAVDLAVGVLMEAHGADAQTARERLHAAAARAGIPRAEVARVVLRGRSVD